MFVGLLVMDQAIGKRSGQQYPFPVIDISGFHPLHQPGNARIVFDGCSPLRVVDYYGTDERAVADNELIVEKIPNTPSSIVV